MRNEDGHDHWQARSILAILFNNIFIMIANHWFNCVLGIFLSFILHVLILLLFIHFFVVHLFCLNFYFYFFKTNKYIYASKVHTNIHIRTIKNLYEKSFMWDVMHMQLTLHNNQPGKTLPGACTFACCARQTFYLRWSAV